MPIKFWDERDFSHVKSMLKKVRNSPGLNTLFEQLDPTEIGDLGVFLMPDADLTSFKGRLSTYVVSRRHSLLMKRQKAERLELKVAILLSILGYISC